MRKLLTVMTLLFALSLSLAETLTAEINKVAYDYAVAMFKAADVTVAECLPEQETRRGFYYLCGKTSLKGDAFEATWTSASVEYGATDEMDAAITQDAWGATGTGNQGLPVYVEGEFIVGQYSTDGDVSVQSGRAY